MLMLFVERLDGDREGCHRTAEKDGRFLEFVGRGVVQRP